MPLILERVVDALQERISDRTGEQVADVPVQGLKETSREITACPWERISERTVGVPILHVTNEILEGITDVPRSAFPKASGNRNLVLLLHKSRRRSLKLRLHHRSMYMLLKYAR